MKKKPKIDQKAKQRHSLRGILSMYSPRFLIEIVYMLQASEYRLRDYLRWFWRTKDVGRIMYRKQLRHTTPAILLLFSAAFLMTAQFFLAWWVIYLSLAGDYAGFQFLGLGILIAQPVVTAHVLMANVLFARWVLLAPMQKIWAHQAKTTFAEHKGKIIAVAGSYGKTTMKEILATVLSGHLKVAATSGNMNTATAHTRFARRLKGTEDVLIVELGEFEPGDIKAFCEVIQPDYGIITGLTNAHMDSFGTLDAAGKNLFDMAAFVKPEHLYVNDENEEMKPFETDNYKRFSRTATCGWSISHAKTSLEGTSFTMTKGKKTMKLKSGLVGKHNVGPLALAAALAVDEFGLKPKQVEIAVASTVPFEHRLQPRQLANGAWLIDDTYNGNIEGVRATMALLKEIKAKRKIYVTPGLVEQGVETVTVHNQIGELAADVADEVILLKNSATPFIEAGLLTANYKGVLRKVDDPIKFYEGIQYLVSAGDVIVLQNDWSDAYA